MALPRGSEFAGTSQERLGRRNDSGIAEVVEVIFDRVGSLVAVTLGARLVTRMVMRVPVVVVRVIRVCRGPGVPVNAMLVQRDVERRDPLTHDKAEDAEHPQNAHSARLVVDRDHRCRFVQLDVCTLARRRFSRQIRESRVG